MDNRRADALVQLAVDALDRTRVPVAPAAPPVRPGLPAQLAPPTRLHRAPAGHRGLRADVHVTVPAGTLLGLCDEPGELAGYGPIPASMARRLAGDGTWRRVLTDPASGAILDVGRRATQRPPRSPSM